ncbi:MAG TPA: mandelate racemase/muconate lactonizing enzyme family protein [Bryobacteraceae bacterium]|nr:mandelate racemase/muconate lactonizing enzyme family protein [Bryobacteraceae bacterium]
MPLSRRKLLQTALLGGAGTLAQAAMPKMKITRVRIWESPISRPMFNQSFHVVTVETDAGITGIGEGGSRDTVQECAEMLIGEDPSRIDYCWQLMYRGRFYPAGREKLHAMGALDLALWDIKGKALGVPVWQLLGGKSRDYVECYSTGYPSKGNLRDTAQACVDAGFRAFRTSVADPGGEERFQSKHMVQKTFEQCQQIRAGVGKADWCIDYHTRLDLADAVRLSTLIEPLEPFFVEDLVRSENPGVYRQLRQLVKVPIAVGEQFGDRWDINELIENKLIDYNRTTLPNCGGITEYLKHVAIGETHYVGLTPHFTGPISEAALVHVCAAFSGPVLMEMTGAGTNEIPYLPQKYDFRNGKLWPNDRPGLGVTVDTSKLKMMGEFTTRNQPIKMFRRPDGSFTNW